MIHHYFFTQQITGAAKVCEEHFTDDDYVRSLTGKRILKRGAVPSVFPWKKTAPSRKPPTPRKSSSEKSDDHAVNIQ